MGRYPRRGASSEGSQSEAEVLAVGDLLIDPESHTAQVGSHLLSLTPKEFDLLCRLAERPGRVWSRQQLIDAAWTYPDVDMRVVTVHVGNLRRKLAAVEPPGAASPRVETVWNVGYRLAPAPASAGGRSPPQSVAAMPGLDTNRQTFIGQDRELEMLGRAMEVAASTTRVVLIAGEEWIDVHLGRCLLPFYDAEVEELRTVATETAEAASLHGTPLQRAQASLVTWLLDLRQNRLTATDRTLGLVQNVVRTCALDPAPPDFLRGPPTRGHHPGRRHARRRKRPVRQR